ncbi:hypothetical protein GCM10010121_096020 [Streptomyces brasiliensis]|uniref:S8 family serine peptidase n=1 Tax=Streptomyces brasiliensis TaxID=1954 RepID=A0A917PBS7_9ACTN|nr:hypothetical protein GCM10010121_096020 [Streptomyces brasiliensis]
MLTVGLTILGTAMPMAVANAAEPVQQASVSGAGQTTDTTAVAQTTDSATDSTPINDAELAKAVSADGKSIQVTLVTGDKVNIGLDDTGKVVVRDTQAAARPDGTSVVFHTITRTGRAYVVPNDALNLVTDGVLDWSLFDLTELAKLVASGRNDEVPVIVTYSDDDDVSKTPKVAGATAGRALRSVDGRAMAINKNGKWWKGVRGKTGSASAARSAGSLAGVKKVWLNGLSEVSLDQSVPQIGADVAWGRGYDGKGVSVAVLDSGVDATHPDLAGKIAKKVDFTGTSADAKDGFGHGTHVASTIVGSGAASDGKYKGVAPGAKLLIGKVCDDKGQCPDDEVIAGMDWAAHSGAKVVSMSLGGEPTDGTDPMSQALNELSRSTGTLFVVAAGNSGGSATIGAPGAADEALTVAAVDKSDKIADFSSRGPRYGDYALKPDIAAPGVGIVAARAAGTTMGTPVNDYYTSSDGTSMATPHVAGAAAVVAQQHPELTGAQMKALLMSTAKDLGFDENEQGAGRVDLAKATEPQQVVASGTLNFGRQAYPSSSRTRTVTYTNLTDTATTLDLAASLSSGDTPAPAGLISLSADKVTVPAGGSSEVTVTLDGSVISSGGPFGRLNGVLTARDASGDVRATTRISSFLEAERAQLTMKVVPPDGASSVTYGNAVFMPVDDKDSLHEDLTTEKGSESTTVSLYKDSTYSATIPVTWTNASGELQSAAPVLAEVTTAKATTVTLDLRKLVPVSVSTPVATETYSAISSTERVSATGKWSLATSLTASYQAQETAHWWALPTEKVHTGTLTQNTYSVRTTPVVTMKAVGGGDAFDLSARYQTPDVALKATSILFGLEQGVLSPYGIGAGAAPIPRLQTKGRVPVVYAGTGTAAELADVDVKGKLALLTPTDLCGTTCDFDTLRDQRLKAAAAAGAVGVLVAAPGLTNLNALYNALSNAEGCLTPENCFPLDLDPNAPLPLVTVAYDQAQRLIERIKAAPSDVGIVLGGSATPTVYAARFVAQGQVPSNLEYHIDKDRLQRVDHFFHSDQPGTLDKLTWEEQTEAAPSAATLDLPTVATQHTLTVYVQQQDNAINRFDGAWGDNTDNNFALIHTRTETHDLVLSGKNEVHWNEGPSVPGAVPQVRTKSGFFTAQQTPCAACRQGNTFYPTFYLTSSGGARQALIGITDPDHLSAGADPSDYLGPLGRRWVFGLDPCGPTAPWYQPTEDSKCEYTLSDASGHKIEPRTQKLTATYGEVG